MPKSTPSLAARVIGAAEGVLAAQKHVSAVDVATAMGVPSRDVNNWRKILEIFREWTIERDLQPSKAPDAAPAGDLPPAFYTRYVLPERKPDDRVVFLILRDSTCSECGVELSRGSFLYMEAKQQLCLACAGMDDLEFLPRGDTALTRRATKHSGPSHAVVVKFSRSRGRYERQGILVTEEALRRAEVECAADAPERARARERSAETRKQEDAVLLEKMTARIRALFPGCPPAEARHIAAHTALRGSGRVGRTEAGRKLDSDAITMAVQAAIHHRHTNYDELLSQGVERADARHAVSEQVDLVLESWRWAL